MPARKKTPRTRTVILLLAAINVLLLVVLVILPRGEVRGRRPVPIDQGPAVGRPRPEVEEPEDTPGARMEPGYVERPARLARVALVIDDVGYDLESLKDFLTITQPITFAVLPQLRHSEEAARLVSEAGHELLLHCPMEAIGGQDPGPGTLDTSLSREEIEAILDENFATVPKAVGMNNHMGSAFTADPGVMRDVMAYLKRTDRFFLDSKTTPESQGARMAGEYQVPALERDVFVDLKPDRAHIEQSMRKGLEIAEMRGSAVLIGHIQHPELIEVLRDLIDELEERRVRFVSLSELLGAAEVEAK